ncbi:hypothetical protein PAXINDRAFT_171929 [Paxillus involutus ATCC 200175]|uniref:Uncharacterized protein n=1 Tax=Paxillus involutus ATCC 200175 TaxID=664439 RepID=A0A0C9SSE4_PAXIN|nr:hypothetical protein PAXINDRAFT_171929 [Paxillus involutus ATCC 200175]
MQRWALKFLSDVHIPRHLGQAHLAEVCCSLTWLSRAAIVIQLGLQPCHWHRWRMAFASITW